MLYFQNIDFLVNIINIIDQVSQYYQHFPILLIVVNSVDTWPISDQFFAKLPVMQGPFMG